MPLLNYTTRVAADRSVQEIQKMLVAHGATAVLADYDGSGNIVALSFKIATPSGPVGFRLPTDWNAVLQVMQEQRRKSRNSRIRATPEHARNVAWRITKDWVEAQLAILETRMVQFDQVFLPYAITKSGATLYETVKSGNLLGPGQ